MLGSQWSCILRTLHKTNCIQTIDHAEERDAREHQESVDNPDGSENIREY